MLRWMTPFLVAIFAIGTAAAESPGATKTADGPAAAKPADSPAAAQPTDSPATAKPADSPATVKSANSPAAAKRAGNPAAPRRATVRAASQLPPGLPRAHYKYRTTVAPAAAPSTCGAAARWWSRKRIDVLFIAGERGSLRATHLRHTAAAGLLDAARLLRYEPFLQL